MTTDSNVLAYGANSLAIYANLFIQIAVTVALVYAGANLGGDTKYVFYGLAAVTGIGVAITAIVKIIVDVGMSILRRKAVLDKARQR